MLLLCQSVDDTPTYPNRRLTTVAPETATITATKNNAQGKSAAASAALLPPHAPPPQPPKKKVRLRGLNTHRCSKAHDDTRLGPVVVYDPTDRVGRFHPQYELLVEACAFYLQAS